MGVCVPLSFNSSESPEASGTRNKHSDWRKCVALGAEKARTGNVSENRHKCRTRVHWEDSRAWETSQGSLRANSPCFPNPYLLAAEFNVLIFGECGKPPSLSSIIVIN